MTSNEVRRPSSGLVIGRHVMSISKGARGLASTFRHFVAPTGGTGSRPQDAKDDGNSCGRAATRRSHVEWASGTRGH